MSSAALFAETPDTALAEFRGSDSEPRRASVPQRWRVDALKPNRWNTTLFPDSLSPNGVKALAEDMRRTGQRTPIVITPDGTIVEGERRWRALQTIGQDMADVLVAGEMTDAEILDAVLSYATSARQMTIREQVLVYQAVATQLKERAGRTQGRPSEKSSPIGEDYLTPGAITAAAAQKAGFTSVRQAERAEAIFIRGSEALQQAVLAGEKAITAAYAEVPKAERKRTKPPEAGPTASPPTLRPGGDAALIANLCGGTVADNPFEDPDAPTEPTAANPERAKQQTPTFTPANAARAFPEALNEPDRDIDVGTEEDEPLAPEECINVVCDHIAALLTQSDDDDDRSALERYEEAKSEVEWFVGRLSAALGEPPEVEGEEEPVIDDEDEDEPLIGADDGPAERSAWDDLDELLAE